MMAADERYTRERENARDRDPTDSNVIFSRRRTHGNSKFLTRQRANGARLCACETRPLPQHYQVKRCLSLASLHHLLSQPGLTNGGAKISIALLYITP